MAGLASLTTSLLDTQELVLLTGMSGAGKNAATKVLEEFGWYVVDNPPVAMIPVLAKEFSRTDDPISRVAVVLDVRTRGLQENLTQVYALKRELGTQLRILYLDASEETLIKRFNAVRRRHPLQTGDGLVDAIERERAILTGLHTRADVVVDTSNLSVHDLRRRLEAAFGNPSFDFQVTVESFGFKYGVPLDVDFQLDMRFLPNPYWEPELRRFSGLDERVSRFVLADPKVEKYLGNAVEMVQIAMEGYRREGKRYMIVGVGCTGGKHRSVAVAERLGQILSGGDNVDVAVMHRDLGRE